MKFAREPAWTESLAVGDRAFVEQVARSMKGRRRFGYAPMVADRYAWSVRDGGVAYSPVS